MPARSHTTRAALAKFTLVVAASAAAASLWAGGRPEPGLLLDAQTWQEEVVTASTGPWPQDGWYRLVPRDRAVEVRAVKPNEPAATVAADALFVRLPATPLKQGLRQAYRDPGVLQQPRPGTDYELSLGAMRFSVRVEPAGESLQYAIGYGGQAYTYVVGPADARTAVRTVADLDGDGHPDFVVDVDDATFLLLSAGARPGPNLPAAELRGHGC